MRQIGELPKDADPRVLEDHLLGLGMKSRIDRRPDGWAVWIIDEDHVDRARKELEAYLAAPDDPKFRATAPTAREVRKKQARLDREFQKNYRYASNLWAAPTFRRRPVTVIVVAIAAVVFVLQHSSHAVETVLSLGYFDWRNGPPDVRPQLGLTDIWNGQVWRLVTPIFLHFSPLHVFFNCYWTMILGTGIETRRGSWKLLAMIIGSAILSNFAEYEYMERLHENPLGGKFYTFGGLSGVNYALFGYVWMMGENHPEEGIRIDSNNTVIMLGWLVLCMTGAVGNVANAAHLAGLAVGMAMGMLRF
ncbi:rhomboid family intramembrane serine protease [Paludisphaera mucosa]|uniref:Rhomboid family intramembrane serine protease n=1 Tax=Paludisphaera mucosa TaxID=3030827 RepID=A0ABT6FHM7_9BACT|nr:rhomboid family intramembrane serine protease [Paludisphaera mucosa]MDG3007059.1 rhomboid family intramembrane serine protease [Paludisphaera mucosa]